MPTTDDQQLETWNVTITADTSDLETKLATTSRLGVPGIQRTPLHLRQQRHRRIAHALGHVAVVPGHHATLVRTRSTRRACSR